MFRLGICQCGCGEEIPIKTRTSNYLQRFKQYHHSRLSKLGDKNSMWKADNIKYSGLHEWVRKHYPKLEFCEICYNKPPRDLANKTGIYDRNINNWYWVCRRCHMISDGRMNNLKQYK